MASNDATTKFGATIQPTPTRPSYDLTLPPSLAGSPALTPVGSREDLGSEGFERRVPATSPFYQHPLASFERVHSRQSSKADLPAFEKDLERGRLTTEVSREDPFSSKVSVDCSKQDCKMWPSKETLLQSKIAEKKQKRDQQCCGGCAPVRDSWERLTRRQKLLFKIGIALFIVGIIVAIAVGITIAVHGTVYAGSGHQDTIPNPDNS